MSNRFDANRFAADPDLASFTQLEIASLTDHLGIIFVSIVPDFVTATMPVRRALEVQCYFVQSPTIGILAWSPAVEENYGFAANYARPDTGFPPKRVLAPLEPDDSQWVLVDIGLIKIGVVRGNGEVLNFRDWQRQSGILL